MSGSLSTTSSASSSANPSPASIQLQALHHPEEMAHVEVPKGVENIPQGMSIMGGTALLAKKMAASGCVRLFFSSGLLERTLSG